MGGAGGAITHRRIGEAGLSELVASVGREHMTVVEVGSFAGDSAHMFLDTGKVDTIYCVDPWIPGYDSSDISSSEVVAAEQAFDASFAGDSRVVKVKATLQQAISAAAVPRHVDMVYVDGCSLYDRVTADLVSARGMCDFLAGHDIWNADVRRAISDVVGRPPDVQFSDTSWIVRAGNAAYRVPDLQEVVRRRFDRILCLTCPQSVGTRFPLLMQEFSDLGLGDMVLPFPNVHNAIAHAELDRRRFANEGAKGVNVKNVTLGHYSMIRFARDAGFKCVMIVEDDCRFVRPSSLVARYLDELPGSGNSVLCYTGIKRPVLDAVFPPDTWLRWGRIPAGTFFDLAVCYTLGRSGMECLTEYYEKCGTDGYRWPVDACDRVWPHLTASTEVYVPRVGLVHHGLVPSVTAGVAV